MMTIHTRKTTVSTLEWQRNLRRSARVKATFQMQIWTVVDGEKLLFPGYARNVSAGGVGAFIPANLEINQKLELQFTLPRSSKEIIVQGIVRSVDEFHYGVEFMGLDPAAHRVLRAFAMP
jgi:c-di-GMP-binding flagellar brake protein YcgR